MKDSEPWEVEFKVMVSQVYVYVIDYHIVYFKYVQVIVC